MRFASARPAALLLLAATTPSRAQEVVDRTGFFLAPQASTLGLGIEAGWRATDYLGVRVGANFFNIDRSFNVNGIDYKADARLRSYGVLADVFPFAGSFRLTGGVRVNDNGADLSAVPTTSVTLGNNSYTPAQVGQLSGKLDFNLVAPYLGFGLSTTIFSPNIYFGADLGVMFQGSPKVSLSASGGLASPQFAADLERERRDVENKARDFRYYPVIALSIGYRF